MNELEDGELSEEDSLCDDGEEEVSDGEECVATSLFDALAAAQEASNRYHGIEEPAAREDHRLPDDYLVLTYSSCIEQHWRRAGTQTTDEGLSERFKKGYLCEAVWPGDGEWYPAKVIRVKEWKERVVVRYRGFSKDDEEEVGTEQIRHRQRKRSKTKRRSGKKRRKIAKEEEEEGDPSLEKEGQERQKENVNRKEKEGKEKDTVHLNLDAVKKVFIS